MELKDLFTTYWSQTTLLLLGIGYFFKRGLDIKSKKLEINHSLYQQNTLSAVNRFFESYAKAELMWNQIEIYDIISHKLSASEIDLLVYPTINDLRKNLFELMIYFNESDYNKFYSLYSNLDIINEKMSELFFEYNPEISETMKSAKFALAKLKAFQNNNEIMAELSDVIKLSFKV